MSAPLIHSTSGPFSFFFLFSLFLFFSSGGPLRYYAFGITDATHWGPAMLVPHGAHREEVKWLFSSPMTPVILLLPSFILHCSFPSSYCSPFS